LNKSFFSSVFILICVGIAFLIDDSITLTTALNLIVLFGFAFVSYLCGIISINFSAQSYTTIESQAKENDKLMEDVLRDRMTGLYNHSSFAADLRKTLKAYEKDKPVFLAMIDVDDFKSINDTYGHDCGDVILTSLADILRKRCTDSITAYRYGGEEFAMIFVGRSGSEATGVLQSALEEFVSRKYPFTDRAVTFSAGVAEYTSGVTSETFFEQADQTLYSAKRQGKNRVITKEAYSAAV
jgi:diguanylate cyclase (GGDEF)-like protein